MSESPERLRPHPGERFAGDSHVFDLNDALRALRSEAHAGQEGHRQVTIFHRAPVTQVLFAFEAGSELADHAAPGLVTIHALEGHLTVVSSGQAQELGAGMIQVLAPGVRHSVSARSESAMLLTVHLEKRAWNRERETPHV